MTPTDPTPYTPTDEDRLVDDISSIIKRGRYNRSGPGRPSDNPLDRRDARQIVNYLAARDARVRAEAVAPVLALHRKMPLYDLASECKTPDDEDHADARHSESDDGELLCWDLPAGVVCEHCRDTDGSLVDHPCETFAAASIEQETQP